MEKPSHEPVKYKFSITSACTSCEDCVQVCPTQSIFLGRNQFVIDSDTCDGTGLCSDVCPVRAIVKIEEQPTVQSN